MSRALPGRLVTDPAPEAEAQAATQQWPSGSPQCHPGIMMMIAGWQRRGRRLRGRLADCCRRRQSQAAASLAWADRDSVTD